MASPYGVSFVPGAEAQNGKGNGGAVGRSPDAQRQEAIQILSLRLPKVYGTRAIAPAPLLTAPGGMGQPAAKGNVVAEALAGLAGLTPRQQPIAPAQIPTTNPYTEWLRQEQNLNPFGGDSSSDDGAPPSAPSPVSWTPSPAPAPPPRVTPALETGEGPSQPVPIPKPWYPPIAEIPVYEPPAPALDTYRPWDAYTLGDLISGITQDYR